MHLAGVEEEKIEKLESKQAASGRKHMVASGSPAGQMGTSISFSTEAGWVVTDSFKSSRASLAWPVYFIWGVVAIANTVFRFSVSYY